ncbi:flagellar hook-associated protein FlgK [Paracoccus ravus]|uniref:flagellar hook-associated protein FlgK n=1 Tax=Paracoccus ravus TaxID=2447760 RepID=UPI00106E0D78|nr:flagellar hook-associated protein FlgK [Paracoccus ravus]
MSLSSAISSALSGLAATTRGTEIVATNISNKSVAGYARRELSLSSRVHAADGAGVKIDGVQRMVNAALLRDSRIAQANAAASGNISAFQGVMETTFGGANDSSSLASMLTNFDSALISASARPDSDVRLREVLDASTALSSKVRDISQAIADARTTADTAIATDVERLNLSLARVASLNRQITALSSQGQDTSSLMDLRQAAIDEISETVPIVEVTRSNGQIALFTQGGIALLDGSKPASIEFSPAGDIAADMTMQNGSLGTLVINGRSLSANELAGFAGGSIAANFEIRDRLAPGYQAKIDGWARDLYERFSDPSVDPSLSPGSHGLFTDLHSAFDPANETGFASRIFVTGLVSPDQGGDLWRLRSGIQAVEAGDVGASDGLLRMSAVLSENRVPSSSSLSHSPRSLLTIAGELSSQAASLRLSTEATAGQDQARSDSLTTARLSLGVDTDSEMQALLALETAYAANAKVLQTTNDMLDQILRLT